MRSFSERLRQIAKPKVFGLQSRIEFGQYKNLRIVDILEYHDPRYIKWCIEEKIFELDKEAFLLFSERLEALENEMLSSIFRKDDDDFLRFGAHKYE